MSNIHLVTIDPQIDFHPGGALPVEGADKDADRLARMIRDHGHKLTDWHITFDLHNRIDIGHPLMWVNSKGKHPDPFTQITASDLKDGVYRPVYEPWEGYFVDYTKKLEEKQRYPMMVWPEHCLIGHPGSTLYPPVLEAMLFWEESEKAIVDKVTKGLNPFTEHYSALKAEVPFTGRADKGINGDPATQVNMKFISALKEADVVLYSGQALSHCVRYTFEDTLAEFGIDNARKLYLLEDLSSCVISPVVDFVKLTDEFLQDALNKGANVTTSEKFWKM